MRTVTNLPCIPKPSRKSHRRLALPASQGNGDEARMIRELIAENARLKANIRALVKEENQLRAKRS
jgi:hypothetical protein